MKMRDTIHKDIMYVVGTELGDNAHFVRVEALRIFGFEADGALLYRLKGVVSTEPTKDRAQAERMLEGSVKWDGCADLSFEPDSNEPGAANRIHFCGADDVADLAEMFSRLYAQVKEDLDGKADW